MQTLDNWKCLLSSFFGFSTDRFSGDADDDDNAANSNDDKDDDDDHKDDDYILMEKSGRARAATFSLLCTQPNTSVHHSTQIPILVH